ncbi:MAG: urease accessory protein UreD [Actinobacteria bacterium]|nr:urease accessory protein UreD [Actinomycetota bacterium]
MTSPASAQPSGRGHRARARVAAEFIAGRTRCSTLRSDPPLTFRETSGGLVWIGTAAGPVGGDRLALEVRVGGGAHLHVTSAAASLVQPGPWGERSRLDLDLSIAAGGSLHWAPEPTVVFAGADHDARTRVTVGAGADLVLVEVLVLGRCGEAPGHLRWRTDVDGDVGPVLRTGLDIGAPGWDGAGGLAAHRTTGQVLLFGAPAQRWADGGADAVAVACADQDVRWADMALAGGGVLVSVLSTGAPAVQAVVGAVVELAGPDTGRTAGSTTAPTVRPSVGAGVAEIVGRRRGL